MSQDFDLEEHGNMFGAKSRISSLRSM